MASPLQVEAQAAGPVGADQQRLFARLKGIDQGLTLGRPQTTREQATAQAGLKQLGRGHEGTEHHDRFTAAEQAVDEVAAAGSLYSAAIWRRAVNTARASASRRTRPAAARRR